jgi:hypothetical protein
LHDLHGVAEIVRHDDLRAAIIDGAVPFVLPAGLLLKVPPQMTQKGFTPTPLTAKAGPMKPSPCGIP